MRTIILPLVFLLGLFSYAQDLTQIGKAKLLTVNGGVSANSVFYEGSAMRQPFTYVLSGNVNLNFSGIYNVPLSFTYSNQEFSYNQPFQFNRLSIHPSYKWITAHIGDVAMTFSPYTLSGHQFTGLGVDLTPKGPFKISAMYGRLIRSEEYDATNTQSIPAYKRIGYGLKTSYDFQKARVGLTFFSAKDQLSSLELPIPVELGIAPKENLVVSVDGSVPLFGKGTLNVEYASSAVTEDINAADSPSTKGLLSFIFDEKVTTSYYDAIKADITYSVGSGSLGIGYERIDPNYRTLGSYYFNNDFENITVNASQTILNGKLNIAVNAGLQSDNLDDTKQSELERVVTAVNLNLNASDRFNISGSYSNFQSFTNIRNQFDFINEVTPFDNIDTLNFRQLSQNANLAASYKISTSKQRPQSINFNLSYQDTQDVQQQIFTGNENTVGASNFYNAATSYSLAFPEQTISVSAAFNATYNEAATTSSTTLGPTLSISKQFFDKRLKSSLSSSYNTSKSDGAAPNSVFNIRANAGYQLFEKHNFNLSVLSLFRNTATQNANDFTVNFGYSYSFSTGKKKKKTKGKPLPNGEEGKEAAKFRFKGVTYEGDTNAIVAQIDGIRNLPAFKEMPLEITSVLDAKRKELMASASEKKSSLKEKALDYLSTLYSYQDFDLNYNTALFNTSKTLYLQANGLDYNLEKELVDKLYILESSVYEGVAPSEMKDDNTEEFKEYGRRYADFANFRAKFVGHRYMLSQLEQLSVAIDFDKIPVFKKFKTDHLTSTFKKYTENNGVLDEVSPDLLKAMIQYLEQLAKKNTDSETYVLKHITRKE